MRLPVDQLAQHVCYDILVYAVVGRLKLQHDGLGTNTVCWGTVLQFGVWLDADYNAQSALTGCWFVIGYKFYSKCTTKRTGGIWALASMRRWLLPYAEPGVFCGYQSYNIFN